MAGKNLLECYLLGSFNNFWYRSDGGGLCYRIGVAEENFVSDFLRFCFLNTRIGRKMANLHSRGKTTAEINCPFIKLGNRVKEIMKLILFSPMSWRSSLSLCYPQKLMFEMESSVCILFLWVAAMISSLSTILEPHFNLDPPRMVFFI